MTKRPDRLHRPARAAPPVRSWRLERLALITLARAAGFSLDEIARVFAPEGQARIDRRLLAAKADELDRTIRMLSAMRDGLRHAVACPAPSHMECPTISADRAGCGGWGHGARARRASGTSMKGRVDR